MQEKIIGYLKKIENPFQLQVGEMLVEIKYSSCNKEINECMLNILKQKIRK